MSSRPRPPGGRSRSLTYDQAAHRATAAFSAGQFTDAAATAQRCLKQRPRDFDMRTLLGLALIRLKEADRSIAHLRKATALRPKDGGAWSNLGLALAMARRRPEAIAAYRRALDLMPGQAEIMTNLGVLLKNEGLWEEAKDVLQEAVGKTPDQTIQLAALGQALVELGQVSEGLEAYRSALARRPDDLLLHRKFGFALLRSGHLREGWKEYDWRFLEQEALEAARDRGEPQWKGEAIGEAPLRVWGEQGVGDEILYGTLLPDLIDRGMTVHLECEPRLVPLFKRSLPGLAGLYAHAPGESPAPPCAWQSSLSSLGHGLRPDLESFGSGAAYLKPDEDRRSALRARYASLANGRPIIGVSWRSANKTIGDRKSTDILDWRPVLAAVPAFFVNLQYGDCVEDLKRARQRFGIDIHHDDTVDQLTNMDAFAAQVAALDLVVSVSNTTVHVAGALGLPCWTMITQGRGMIWYWFLEREDSPWYASVRLFRQSRKGEWSDVMDRVAAALKTRFGA